MPEIDLDGALRSLVADDVFPATPELRAAVLERLDRAPRRVPWSGRIAGRAAVLAAVLALMVAAAVTAAVLVLPGLRLTLVEQLPNGGPPPDSMSAALRLGEPVDATDERVQAATPAELGTPAEAYVDEHGVLTLLYGSGAGLPELEGGSGIGLLVQAITGRLDEARVEKLAQEANAEVIAVREAGIRGYWISGPPHLVHYLGTDGSTRSEATRLAGDTLVWTDGATLYRIESALGLERTLEIAQSIGVEGTAP